MGKLVFKDGLLTRAFRNGDWIVLDELNLAPTDVPEALNRLLDDNWELVAPETQEVVKPHPHFMLFATQNPPGLYAGRKILSRSFRNRFLRFTLKMCRKLSSKQSCASDAVLLLHMVKLLSPFSAGCSKGARPDASSRVNMGLPRSVICSDGQA